MVSAVRVTLAMDSPHRSLRTDSASVLTMIARSSLSWVRTPFAALKRIVLEWGECVVDEGEPVSGSGGGGELGALDRGGESLAPRPVGRVPRGA